MKRLLVLVFVSAVLLLTCSKKSTGPDEPKLPVRTLFEISYVADPSRAVSEYISAEAGGVIKACDKDSVAFELTIPPHALPSGTTITITPFSFLQIGGPGGDTCPSCTGSDKLCCYRGALFEPSGLILDSPAVLTVQLPSGMAFPYPHGGLIVYLDSAARSYQPCFTTYDTAAGWLRADISHFSGYGVDDERYDRMEEEIYEAGERLAAAVGTWEFYMDLYPLVVLRLTCDGCDFPDLPLNACYPDLIAAVEKIVLDAYSRHAAIVRGKAVLQEPCDALGNLYMCFANVNGLFVPKNWNNAGEFASLKAELVSDWVALARKTANEGHRLCEADSCDQGIELLSCVNEQIRHDPFDGQSHFDYAFCASVNNWMLECQQCQIDVSLNADKSTIYDLATSPSDNGPYVNFEVWVRRGLTGYVANQLVVVEGIRSGSNERFSVSGTTDTAGIARMRYVWNVSGESHWNKPPGAYEVKAHVTRDVKAYESDPMTLTLAPTCVAMSYSYQYTLDVDIPMETRTVVANITGVGVQGFANDCPSKYSLSRSIDINVVFNGTPPSYSSTVNDLPGACFIYINSETGLNDSQVVVTMLKSVDVEYDYPYTGPAAYTYTVMTPTDTTTNSLTTEHVEDWLISTTGCYTPKWGDYRRVVYDNGFEALTWDTTEVISAENWNESSNTSLQISLSVAK
jgi:hypothetical protein